MINGVNVLAYAKDYGAVVAVITSVVVILVLTRANGLGTAVFADVVARDVSVRSVCVGTAPVTGMVKIRVLTGAEILAAAVVAAMINGIDVLASTNALGAAVVAAVIARQVSVLTKVSTAAVVAGVVDGIYVTAKADALGAAVVTRVVKILVNVLANALGSAGLLVADVIAILVCVLVVGHVFCVGCQHGRAVTVVVNINGHAVVNRDLILADLLSPNGGLLPLVEQVSSQAAFKLLLCQCLGRAFRVLAVDSAGSGACQIVVILLDTAAAKALDRANVSLICDHKAGVKAVGDGAACRVTCNAACVVLCVGFHAAAIVAVGNVSLGFTHDAAHIPGDLTVGYDRSGVVAAGDHGLCRSLADHATNHDVADDAAAVGTLGHAAALQGGNHATHAALGDDPACVDALLDRARADRSDAARFIVCHDGCTAVAVFNQACVVGHDGCNVSVGVDIGVVNFKIFDLGGLLGACKECNIVVACVIVNAAKRKSRAVKRACKALYGRPGAQTAQICGALTVEHDGKRALAIGREDVAGIEIDLAGQLGVDCGVAAVDLLCQPEHMAKLGDQISAVLITFGLLVSCVANAANAVLVKFSVIGMLGDGQGRADGRVGVIVAFRALGELYRIDFDDVFTGGQGCIGADLYRHAFNAIALGKPLARKFVYGGQSGELLDLCGKQRYGNGCTPDRERTAHTGRSDGKRGGGGCRMVDRLIVQKVDLILGESQDLTFIGREVGGAVINGVLGNVQDQLACVCAAAAAGCADAQLLLIFGKDVVVVCCGLFKAASFIAAGAGVRGNACSPVLRKGVCESLDDRDIVVSGHVGRRAVLRIDYSHRCIDVVSVCKKIHVNGYVLGFGGELVFVGITETGIGIHGVVTLQILIQYGDRQGCLFDRDGHDIGGNELVAVAAVGESVRIDQNAHLVFPGRRGKTRSKFGISDGAVFIGKGAVRSISRQCQRRRELTLDLPRDVHAGHVFQRDAVHGCLGLCHEGENGERANLAAAAKVIAAARERDAVLAGIGVASVEIEVCAKRQISAFDLVVDLHDGVKKVSCIDVRSGIDLIFKSVCDRQIGACDLHC